MKRWTNGLPGATARLGAIMALRGLSVSQPRMRADTHAGPEQHAPHTRPNTLMQHLTFVVLEVCLATRGRAIHMAHRVERHDPDVGSVLATDLWFKIEARILACTAPGQAPSNVVRWGCLGVLPQ